MRRSVVYLTLLTALGGATVAIAGTLATHWWITRHTHSTADFGWFSYGQPRRYADYLPVRYETDWPALLIPAAIAGAVVALLLVGLGVQIYRRVTSAAR